MCMGSWCSWICCRMLICWSGAEYRPYPSSLPHSRPPSPSTRPIPSSIGRRTSEFSARWLSTSCWLWASSCSCGTGTPRSTSSSIIHSSCSCLPLSRWPTHPTSPTSCKASDGATSIKLRTGSCNQITTLSSPVPPTELPLYSGMSTSSECGDIASAWYWYWWGCSCWHGWAHWDHTPPTRHWRKWPQSSGTRWELWSGVTSMT